MALTSGDGFTSLLSSGFSSSDSGTGSGSDQTQGTDAGGTAADSAGTANSSNVSSISTAANQTAVNMALGLLGVVPGLSTLMSISKTLTSLQNPQIPNMLPPNITFDPNSLSVGSDDAIGAPSGSVSIGQAVGMDAVTGESVGVSGIGSGAQGSASDGGGTSGGAGDGTGGPSGGDGWANGGQLPRQANDPSGTRDTIQIPVSGGEFVMPTDVVQVPGMAQFLEMIRQAFHKPVHG